MRDSSPRPRGTTREEAELRRILLTRKITFVTYQFRFNKLKKAGLIMRSGKVLR